MDKTRFSIEDLVTGAAATKEEQEYLSTLYRSEADSLGRIATVVLRLLELDGPLAQAATNQLASLELKSGTPYVERTNFIKDEKMGFEPIHCYPSRWYVCNPPLI